MTKKKLTKVERTAWEVAINPAMLPEKIEILRGPLDSQDDDVRAGVAGNILDLGCTNTIQFDFIMEHLDAKHRGLSHNCLRALFELCKREEAPAFFGEAEKTRVVDALLTRQVDPIFLKAFSDAAKWIRLDGA